MNKKQKEDVKHKMKEKKPLAAGKRKEKKSEKETYQNKTKKKEQ